MGRSCLSGQRDWLISRSAARVITSCRDRSPPSRPLRWWPCMFFALQTLTVLSCNAKSAHLSMAVLSDETLPISSACLVPGPNTPSSVPFATLDPLVNHLIVIALKFLIILEFELSSCSILCAHWMREWGIKMISGAAAGQVLITSVVLTHANSCIFLVSVFYWENSHHLSTTCFQESWIYSIHFRWFKLFEVVIAQSILFADTRVSCLCVLVCLHSLPMTIFALVAKRPEMLVARYR